MRSKRSWSKVQTAGRGSDRHLQESPKRRRLPKPAQAATIRVPRSVQRDTKPPEAEADVRVAAFFEKWG